MAVFTLRATCRARRFLSAFFDGTLARLPLTVTTPVMPGWTSQKYVYLPFFLKVTVIGFGFGASGSPLWIPFLPL